MPSAYQILSQVQQAKNAKDTSAFLNGVDAKVLDDMMKGFENRKKGQELKALDLNEYIDRMTRNAKFWAACADLARRVRTQYKKAQRQKRKDEDDDKDSLMDDEEFAAREAQDNSSDSDGMTRETAPPKSTLKRRKLPQQRR